MTAKQPRYPLVVAVALAASALPGLASAADKPVTDVTITVVEDPKQLKEKVNTISLPEAGAESHSSHAAAKAAGGRARNDRENSHHEHEDSHPDAADNARSDSNAAKSDANDAHSDATENANKADD